MPSISNGLKWKPFQELDGESNQNLELTTVQLPRHANRSNLKARSIFFGFLGHQNYQASKYIGTDMNQTVVILSK